MEVCFMFQWGGGGVVFQMGGASFLSGWGGAPWGRGTSFDGGCFKKILGWGVPPHYGKP